MGDLKAAKECGFDVLLSKSVPHIIEKIFLDLDFDSFMACREVSRGWNALLSSGAYRNRPIELLRERLREEKKKMEGEDLEDFKKSVVNVAILGLY